MTYTEEEAKTKWCPAIRFSGAGTATDQDWLTNRAGSYGETAFTCIGSDCMAWRWKTYSDPTTGIGYCGLAGKP